MEVPLSAEAEAQLASIAARNGMSSRELVEQVLTKYLERDHRFLEAVQIGLAEADRGEFVEDEEVWANVEKILQS